MTASNNMIGGKCLLATWCAMLVIITTTNSTLIFSLFTKNQARKRVDRAFILLA